MADSTTDRTSVLVATPFGLRPAANAHAVPTGGTVRHVGEEIHLLDATGKVVHTAGRAPSLAESKSGNDEPSAFHAAATAIYSISTDDTNPDAITKSVASWTVPPTLVDWTGETMFFHSMVRNNAYGGLDVHRQSLVSALQYGPSAAGGGKYWSIAVWHLTAQQTYCTPVTKVFPGTALTALFTVVPGTNRWTASIFSHAPGPTYIAEFDDPFFVMGISVGPRGLGIPVSPPSIPTVFGPLSIGVMKDGKPSVPDVGWKEGYSSRGVTWVVDKEGVDDSQITFNYQKL